MPQSCIYIYRKYTAESFVNYRMITPFKKVLVSGAIIGSLLVPASGALAQTYSTISAQSVINANCPVLNSNLWLGMRGGDVTVLQAFLATQGYFPYSPVGIYGPLTFRAVQNFQAAHGISATGYVGPLTRGVINSLQNCSQPVPPIPPTPAPFIQSISPASGTVGTSVTLYGYGFANNSMVTFGGSSVGTVYSNTGTSLSFTVPEYTSVCPPGAYCLMMARRITPGVYSIYIQNQNGTSNTVNFTVVDQVATAPLSITGIDAPASVRIGQAATWTLHTNVQNYVSGSNLHYSVTWGDEAVYPPYVLNASQGLQTSATFTHTYLMAGTYSPTFTVTNEAGQTASASASVVVGY